MMNLILVNVNYVADILESEKGNTNRQEYLAAIKIIPADELVGPFGKIIHNFHFAVKQRVIHIGEEIRIFEICQNRQIQHHTEYHIELTPPATLQTVNASRYEIAVKRCKYKQQHKKSRCLVVKEKAYKKQISISQQYPVSQQTENGKHNRKERPEIKLGEKQRISAVEGEQSLEKYFQILQ